MDFKALKAPFDTKAISWRVGATNQDKTKAIALAYIDARDVMNRLDDVCGSQNWQIKYSHANGKTIADIGIKINDEWIWKAGGAGDTPVEAEKGAISDAFKRAAVLWGIGRYLYDVQNVWVDIEPYGRSFKIKNPGDARLIGALEKAAAGIRVPDEPAPEKPNPTPEQQKAIDFIASVKQEITDAPEVSDIAVVIHRHVDQISKLTDAQQKHINDFAAKQRSIKEGQQ